MTELRMERQAAVLQGAWPGRLVNLVAAVLVVLWSAKWLPAMVAMVRSQTEIGQHGLAAAGSAYAIFELTFVAAHLGVRWLPGVIAIVGAAALTRWWLRRA